MCNAIGVIADVGIVSKVGKTVVQWITVIVSHFLSFGTWADNGKQNQPMHLMASTLSSSGTKFDPCSSIGTNHQFQFVPTA
jgi:hypothetical protein